MDKSLVIVESPAKAKTIKKYLGKGFEVLASYGHIRDLQAKNGAVDPDDNFALKYAISDDKHEEQFRKIEKAVAKVKNLYLATDPDREGEAIAWHLYELLKEKGALEGKHVARVVFHEITKRAIQEAVQNPRELSMDLVNAQLARRALDHLIGFKLSPVLWSKIRIRNLSAGRVQSPALRLIVERELEIKAFKPKEYWTIESDLKTDGHEFKAKLIQFKGKKLTQFSITNSTQAKETTSALNDAAKGKLLIEKITKKKRKRNPPPPFITSTLQQEASRKLGFGAQRTMITAQQLYEGIDIGGETVGLISYMRTDSVNLAQEALDEIRELIASKYGKDDVPAEPRTFKNKTKNAQEAHEAIRPTSVAREPAMLKKSLSRDQFRLYELIWKRTIACQMIHATIDTVSIDLSAGTPENLFRANGSTIATPGFMQVYQESVEESDKKAKESAEQNKGLLPPMQEGDQVDLLKIRPEQHFTEPPPRYSEASLVKALEEYGIGRPSTYAQIINTLQSRNYAKLEKKRFYPTMVGRMVNKFLKDHFTKYVDYDFTAHLEDELNEISRGEREWIPVMEEFWQPLKELIEVKTETVKDAQLDENCPKCGTPLTVKNGKNGLFIGCTAYPDCDYTRNINLTEHQENETEVLEDQKCPQCKSNLIIRQGPYGRFIGCSSYPECKYLKPIQEPGDDTGVKCPECKKGEMLKRRSRKGKIFFSCSRYPDCKYAVWNKPIDETCPECKWPMMTVKTTKRAGSKKICEKCKYSEPYEPEEEDPVNNAKTG